MYYILFYKTVDDYIEKRGAYREEHLKLAQQALENGSLIMAGALSDPADRALLIFKHSDAATHFAQNDPYVKNGIVKEWNIRPWNVVIENK